MPPFLLTDVQKSDISKMQTTPVQFSDDCDLPANAFQKTLEKVAEAARNPQKKASIFPRENPTTEWQIHKTLEDVLKDQPGELIHLPISADKEVRISRVELTGLQTKVNEMAKKLGLNESPAMVLDNYTSAMNTYGVLQNKYGVVQNGNTQYPVTLGPELLVEFGVQKWEALIGRGLADFVTPYPAYPQDDRKDGNKKTRNNYYQLLYDNDLAKREYIVDRTAVETLGVGRQLEAFLIDYDAPKFANYLTKPRNEITASDIMDVIKSPEIFKPHGELQRATSVRVMTDIYEAKTGCTVKVEDIDKILPEGVPKEFLTDQQLRKKAGAREKAHDGNGR